MLEVEDFQIVLFLEALKLLRKFPGVKIKKKFIKQNRIGDHIWYMSNMKKFKKHYPKWKQNILLKKLLKN